MQALPKRDAESQTEKNKVIEMSEYQAFDDFIKE
jgi:hypothetical protein